MEKPVPHLVPTTLMNRMSAKTLLLPLASRDSQRSQVGKGDIEMGGRESMSQPEAVY